MALDGFSQMTNLFGTSSKGGLGISSNSQFKNLLDDGTFGLCPVASIIAWAKTFAANDSGNCDGIGATANVLKDSGQNFETTVVAGMIAKNASASPVTFTTVTSVVSDTHLVVEDDIFDDGDDFVIYKVVALHSDWVECNGQVLTDPDSLFNGETIPALNSTSDANARFLRGYAGGSGLTGGAELHNHTNSSSTTSQSGGGAVSAAPDAIMNSSNLPPFYNVVWIMRIK
jgi:hypothetical protein|tara:strand:- start:2283 stop:2969 length:687 start_codon:yes stop_codon:yes gene_type:complete